MKRASSVHPSSYNEPASSHRTGRLCSARAPELPFITIELADGTRSLSPLAAFTVPRSHICQPHFTHPMTGWRAQQKSRCAGAERSRDHRYFGQVHSGARGAPIHAACAHLRPPFRRSAVIFWSSRQGAQCACRATAVAWSISRGHAPRRVQSLRTGRDLSEDVSGSWWHARSEL